MGFPDGCGGDNEFWVLMIVLVLRGDIFLFSREVYNILMITNSDASCVEVYRGV